MAKITFTLEDVPNDPRCPVTVEMVGDSFFDPFAADGKDLSQAQRLAVRLLSFVSSKGRLEGVTVDRIPEMDISKGVN